MRACVRACVARRAATSADSTRELRASGYTFGWSFAPTRIGVIKLYTLPANQSQVCGNFPVESDPVYNEPLLSNFRSSRISLSSFSLIYRIYRIALSEQFSITFPSFFLSFLLFFFLELIFPFEKLKLKHCWPAIPCPEANGDSRIRKKRLD